MRSIEILSASGSNKDLLSSNSTIILAGNIIKTYERSVKGYVFDMDKALNGTYIQYSCKNKLHITHNTPYLVFQMQSWQHIHDLFHMEITLIDHLSQKKRFHLSTSFTHMECNQLHAKIPINKLFFTQHFQANEERYWINFVIDMNELMHKSFPSSQFIKLESFILRPQCKLKRIFAQSSNDNESHDGLEIPPSMNFQHDVKYKSFFLFDDLLLNDNKDIGLSSPENIKHLKVEGKKAKRRQSNSQLEIDKTISSPISNSTSPTLNKAYTDTIETRSQLSVLKEQDSDIKTQELQSSQSFSQSNTNRRRSRGSTDLLMSLDISKKSFEDHHSSIIHDTTNNEPEFSKSESERRIVTFINEQRRQELLSKFDLNEEDVSVNSDLGIVFETLVDSEHQFLLEYGKEEYQYLIDTL